MEDVHGWVHQDVGGTMADIPPASLDPIFFLHHSYVDFLLWCWQVNYPLTGKYLFEATQQYFPFLNGNGTVVSPADIMSPINLGHNYMISSQSAIWHNGRRLAAAAAADEQQPQCIGDDGLGCRPYGASKQQRQQRQELFRGDKGALAQARRALHQEVDDASATATVQNAADAVVMTPQLPSASPPPPSPTANPKDTLINYVKYLQSEYDGYMYQARLFNVDCKSVGQPWIIMGFLKDNAAADSNGGTNSNSSSATAGSSAGGSSDGGVAAAEDASVQGGPASVAAESRSSGSSEGDINGRRPWRSYTNQKNYCSSWGAVSCWMGMAPDVNVSVTLDLTGCLRSSGRNPDQPPKNAANPAEGPEMVPVNLDDLEFRAFIRDTSEEITDKIPALKSSPAVLTWTWIFGRNAPRSAVGKSAIAEAAVAAGLDAVPVPTALFTADVVVGAGGVPAVVQLEERPAVFGRATGVAEYDVDGVHARLL
jgi:hypothetical protein